VLGSGRAKGAASGLGEGGRDNVGFGVGVTETVGCV
jgi:hypothetical protein